MKFEPRTADETVNVTDRHPLADALTLAAGLGVTLLVLVVIVALTADALVSRISVEREMRWFGDFDAPAMVRTESPSAEARAAEALLLRLASHWDSPYRFRLRIADDPAPNALAFPGGLVIVTRGLLDRVGSENELAFVLGHELGHFRNRDHLRQLGRSAAVGLVVSALTSGGGAGFGFGVADLALKGFGREQEADADRFGLELVHAEYGHVNDSWRFFERLDEAGGTGSALVNYIETHPRPVDRIAALRDHAREQGWPTSGDLTPWPPDTR